jgi:hypothetical protein
MYKPIQHKGSRNKRGMGFFPFLPFSFQVQIGQKKEISEVRKAVGSNPTSIILTAMTGESHTWAGGFL